MLKTPSQAQALDEAALAAAFKALGHPARLRILRYLLQEDRCICGRIVNSMPLAQSTVSQHLKILKSAGLIHGEIDGPRTCYCVNRNMLDRLDLSLKTLLSSPEKP